MSTLPSPGIVRVHTESGGVAGTGFLVCGSDGRTYAVTCAHVVNAALRGRQASEQSAPPPGAAVRLSCSADPAPLLHWVAPVAVGKAKASPLADIAILDPKIAPDPSWPVLRVEPPSQVTRDGDVGFHGFGFMGPEDGLPVEGVLRAVDMGGWFVARASEGFGTFIEGGLSGAPLLDRNRRVLGMAVQRHGKEGSAEGLAIPALTLAQAWPVLTNPYVGLRSFQTETAHLFFGRDATVRQLRERLAHQPIVALVGASGSGKSSLARAGLVPRMVAERWRAVVFEPKQHPVAQLAEAISRQVNPTLADPQILEEASTWRATLQEGRLDPALTALAPGAAGVLIVIDQFEQFFTADSDRVAAVEAERATILRMLRDAATRDDVRVVLTLRVDFLPRVLAEDQAAGALLRDPLPPFVLDRMDPAELRTAIVGGAELFGVSVDPGLAAAFAADAAGGDGRLPLLQLALSDLWRGIVRGDGGWRLNGAGSASAGLSRSLQVVADAAVANLESGRRGTPVAADAIDRVLSSMVRLSGPRQLATKRILSGPVAGLAVEPRQAEEWDIVRRLAAERLVILGEADGAPTAELAHDRLIDQWDRLANLIRNDRQFLEWLGPLREFRVPAWIEVGRGDERLLTGPDISIAVKWLAERATQLTPDERAFITASDDKRQLSLLDLQAQLQREQALLAENIKLLGDEERARLSAEHALAEAQVAKADADRARQAAERARRTTQRALRAVGVVAALIAFTAGIAGGGLQEATAERDQARLAQSRVLARQAGDALRQGDPLRAYLVAAQADDWLEPTARPEARATRRDAGATLLARRVRGIEPGTRLWALSADGHVAVGQGAPARAWSVDLAAAKAAELRLPRSEQASITKVSTDGTRLLLSDYDSREFRVLDRTRADAGGAGPPPLPIAPPGTPSVVDPQLRASVEYRSEGLVALDFDTGRRRPIEAASDERPLGLLEGVLLTTTLTRTPAQRPTYRIRRLDRDADPLVLDPGVAPLVSGTRDGEPVILTIDASDGLALWTPDPAGRAALPAFPETLAFASMAPDLSAAFVAGRGTNHMLVWPRTPERAARPVISPAPLLDFQALFNRDGSRLSFMMTDQTAAVLDVKTGRITPKLSQTNFIAPVLSDDGRWLTAFGADGEMLVWDVELLLDAAAADAAMEQTLRNRLADGSAACLTSGGMAALGLLANAHATSGPHACPLGTDEAAEGYGFWRGAFREISRWF